MDSPDQFQKPATRWPLLVGWGLFAAVAGLCCVVLPPYLTPGAMINPGYDTLVPWFVSAFANLRLEPTLSAMFVLGAVLGLGQPRWWPLLCCLTVSLPVLLWGINFVHDVRIDPTSDNLFPFEIAFLLCIASREKAWRDRTIAIFSRACGHSYVHVFVGHRLVHDVIVLATERQHFATNGPSCPIGRRK